MTTEFRKEIPYSFNFEHPYFKQVEFTKNEGHKNSGPYERMGFDFFVSQLINEGVEDTYSPREIKSSKSTYYLRHFIVHEILRLYLEMFKKKRFEGGSFENCTWYMICRRNSRDWDIGDHYFFFIAGRSQIEFEDVGLKCLQKEIEGGILLEETDLLRQPDYLNALGLWEDEQFDKARARYWYRKYYKETELGQILAIQEEMREQEYLASEKEEREKEAADAKQEEEEIRKEEWLEIKAKRKEERAEGLEKRVKEEEESRKKRELFNAQILQTELMTSVNQRLSWVVFLLLILVVKFFFIK